MKYIIIGFPKKLKVIMGASPHRLIEDSNTMGPIFILHTYFKALRLWPIERIRT